MFRMIRAWGVSLLALVLAVLLREWLDPILGGSLPFVIQFGAVAAAVWIGGILPAVVVSALGYLACNVLFILPRGQLTVLDPANQVGLIAYLFTCGVIIAFGETRRRTQAHASERRELLRVTLHSIGDAVVTTDEDARITYMNDVAAALTGWTTKEAVGKPLEAVFRIVNEETRQKVENPVHRALQEGVVVGLANHTLLIRKDGVEHPIDDSAAPIRDEDGRVKGCVLIFRDVTAQRRVDRERAAQLHTARLLSAIVASSDDAIISKSLEGIIQSWNAGAERVFGYTAEEAVGRHISIVIPADRIAEEDLIIGRLRLGERIDHFETERMRKDGARIQVSLTISPIKDEAGQVVGASKIARDVTERRRAESDRQRFVTLVESSTDFIGIYDLQGMPFFVNRAGLQMVGLADLDEAQRTPVREFFFPEDRERVMEEFFPSVLEHGRGEIEIRFRHFKTGEARWMTYKVILLTDRDGHPDAFATVSQDITERRRMEDSLRGLAGSLSQADRRKDEFLATLAHELRNPLAPLSNMLEVLKRSDHDPETRRRARDTIERQLGQMVRLVDDLLDLNRITHDRLELRRTHVDLEPVIHQAVEACRPIADASEHELRVELPKEPLLLHADPVRLAQVFGNLIHNSCKYTRPGGTISVTAERQGAGVEVTVRDTGIGIPGDKLDSIFEMFSQVDRPLERSQGGLGIGLTLVKRLVEMHGGSIEAHSRGENAGSEFVVRLPVVEGALIETTGANGAAPPPTPRRILVVDDNEDAAVSLAMLLRFAGNETFTAHDGIGALESAEAHRPEVVLLDIGLPKMNGHEVARRIRDQPWGRDLVLIALTGWGQEEDRRKSKEAGFDGHLVKPVDYDKLTDLLGTLTHAGDAGPSL